LAANRAPAGSLDESAPLRPSTITPLQASAVARKKAVRSTWQIGFNKALTQNVSHDRVRLYAEAFQKIQDATGER
jgi:hypothetical protein